MNCLAQNQGHNVRQLGRTPNYSVVALEMNFFDRVLSLHKEKKWRDLLEVEFHQSEAARKLLWVWPSESNLNSIRTTIGEFGLEGVTSIGCGCGLFEWLLAEFSGLPVVGYEVNEEWWLSKYCNPQFIKLTFPQLPPSPDILNPRHALLFCYFNDGEAFREYIDSYGGPLVIIIGPAPGSGRHTDPGPFNADFGSTSWVLYKSEEVRNTKDFIAVYVRA